MPRFPTLTLVVLAGCSEFGLFGNRDRNADPGDDRPDDHTDVTPDPDPVCDPLDLSPGEAAIDEGCQPGVSGTIELVVEWQADIGYGLTQPMVGNLTDDNGDGVIDTRDVPDIVFYTFENELVAVSGDTGAVHWRADHEGMLWSPQPALADLDGDGIPEVVVVGGVGSAQRFLIAHEGDTGATKWATNIEDIGFNTTHNSVTVGDMDGDGIGEVAYGNAIFDGASGAKLGQGAWGTGTSVCEAGLTLDRRTHSVIADIDGDGIQELVVGNAAYDIDGNTVWANGQSDGTPALVNVDGDPAAEMVVAFTNAFCAPGTAVVRLQDDDGTVLWTRSYGPHPLTGVGPATVADLDGDGELEIVVALYDYGHTPASNWIALNLDGTEMWAVGMNSPYDRVLTGMITAMDIDLDGAAELFVHDGDALRVLDGSTGADLASIAVTAPGGHWAPTLADVDGDGHVEVVVPHGNSLDPADPAGITVIGGALDDWPSAPPVWSEWGHHPGRIDDDLSLKSLPERNWVADNGFRNVAPEPRAGDVDASIQLADTCLDECELGRAHVAVRVGSEGLEPVPAGAGVTVHGLQEDGTWTLLDAAVTETELAPGDTSDGIAFEIARADAAGGRVRVTVDGDDRLEECDEHDNSIEIDVCP